MNEERVAFGLVAVMNNLFAIGGYNGERWTETVEKYCPESNTWSFVKSMESVRNCLRVAVLPRL